MTSVLLLESLLGGLFGISAKSKKKVVLNLMLQKICIELTYHCHIPRRSQIFHMASF
jgi:hypothetical protein